MTDDRKPGSSRPPERTGGPATPNRDKQRAAPVIDAKAEQAPATPAASGAQKDGKPAAPGAQASGAQTPGAQDSGAAAAAPSNQPSRSGAPAAAPGEKGADVKDASDKTRAASGGKDGAPAGGKDAAPAGQERQAASPPPPPPVPPAASGGGGRGFAAVAAAGIVGAALALFGSWILSGSEPANADLADLRGSVSEIRSQMTAQQSSVEGLEAWRKEMQGTALAGLESRIAGLEKIAQGQEEAVASLRGEVSRLAEREPPAAAVPDIEPSITAAMEPLMARVAALETALKQTQADIAAAAPTGEPAAADAERPQQVDAGAIPGLARQALAPQLAELTDRIGAVAARIPPPVDLEPVTGRVGAIETRLDSIEGGVQTLSQALTAAQTAAEKSLAGAIAGVTETLRSDIAQARARADVAARAVVARTLLEQVSDGVAFGETLAAARALGADAGQVSALEPHAAGVRSLPQLRQAFAALERDLAQEEAPAPDAGVLERLTHGARSLVRVQPLGQPEGDAPEQVLARMRAAMQTGDLRAVDEEAARLPAPARLRAADFLADLRARIAAMNAARAVFEEALQQAQRQGT